jgi:hypothetical protein
VLDDLPEPHGTLALSPRWAVAALATADERLLSVRNLQVG